ncbi:MAG: MCE family protein [Solirubrobacterales bacterium]|nr:MCE family protein [Solirubrobacterales bacterium]
MNKQAPSIGQLITIAGFALSCFGLLLFVWIAFGGPTPLSSAGYELKLPLAQTGQLAAQSEVKVSGVSVGRVSSVDLGSGDQADRAIVTMEIDPEYAPVPTDTRAILRAKSLLGEAYIELTPGDKAGGTLEEGSELPEAQIAQSIQLDEIFRTFDPKTREAFKQGAIDNAIATHGRGDELNQTLGILPGTFNQLTDVLRVLNDQEGDVTRLVRNTGVVFDALSRRQGELSGLIRNTNEVFSTTAAREQDLQDFFRVFPTFLRESQITQTQLGDFSAFAAPIMDRQIPVAKQLSPTLKASARLAPVSVDLYRGLGPLNDKAPKAFPSLRGFLDQDAPKLLARLPDFLSELNPVLDTAKYYRSELTGFLANTSAATNSRNFYNGEAVRYARIGVSQGPEAFGAPASRMTTNRANPYVAQNGYSKIGSGLDSFQTYNCGGGFNATIKPWAALTPVQQAQYQTASKYLDAAESEELWGQIITLAMDDRSQTDDLPAPACNQQAPFTPIGDPSRPATQYQHVFRAP